MDESKPNVARKRQSAPYFTVPKRAMVVIREKVEGTKQTFCCAVYVALRWKANEGINHDGPFSAAVGDIAHRAGCCYNKAARTLLILESIGVLGIEKQFCENKKTRSPSVFTFLLPEGTPLRTIGGTPYAQAEGDTVPRLEKEQKEPKEPILAPNGASELFEIAAQQIAPASNVRRRDPLLEALVAFDGSNPADATASAWGAAGKALAEIKDASPEVTLAEITRRAANYRTHFPDATTSGPKALSKHWACCQNARATATATATNGRPEATVNRLNLKAP